MKTRWTGRVVTDTRGDKSTTYDDLKDWPLDIDVEEAEYLYAAAHEN